VITRYLNLLPLRSTRLCRPSRTTFTSHLRKKTPDLGSGTLDLPDNCNHAPGGAATCLHALSLFTTRDTHAPELTSPNSMRHSRSQPVSSPVCSTLDHNLEVLLSFWCTNPHQIISFSQAHKLRVLLNAPDPNPSSGFRRKNKKKKKKQVNFIFFLLIFFSFFLARSRPLVGSWPTTLTDNYPIGLMFFFFLFFLASNQPLVSSTTPTNNCPIGLNFFFFFLARSWPLVGSRPTAPTDNRQIWLIFFFFPFLLGLQSALSWF